MTEYEKWLEATVDHWREKTINAKSSRNAIGYALVLGSFATALKKYRELS